ncbi:MAG: MBL fold metallo-hydrolase [Acidimicrobiales bacterium]|nr:MBL fold metallo-hydrolase [Acidimicrobiales bacterium]MYG87970.1 MBL fold metallo-hydrolase [Acidimicrobiales bacterium]MYI28344.1 MBL fold metallo-hydrolase [Acidimicrobiales bacterium]
MKPRRDEVEITVLGKGYGESIVVHTGDGAWVIIDSFLEHRSRDPAPLAYLKSIEVDVERDVTSVVLSHLHADHYEGIEHVMSECKSAWLYLPGVLPGHRWKEVLTHAGRLATEPYRGLKKVSAAIQMAHGRSKLRIIGSDSEIETRLDSSLRCIGPTSAALTADIFDNGITADRVEKLIKQANYTSTVLWLRVGEARALLTADFDARDRHLGWTALMAEQAAKHWIEEASLVKVPHHGSLTAHRDEIYTKWATKPVAVITGNRPNRLPNSDVVDKLRSLCAQVHHTSGPGPDGAASSDAHDGYASSADGPTGRVTARRRASDTQWSITHGGSAWHDGP